jgi:hypothetical protein
MVATEVLVQPGFIPAAAHQPRRERKRTRARMRSAAGMLDSVRGGWSGILAHEFEAFHRGHIEE